MTGRQGAAISARRLLLATDLTPACDRGFDRAIQLARLWCAHLMIVHVVETAQHGVAGESLQHNAARLLLLQRLLKSYSDDPSFQLSYHLSSGPVAQAIVALAQELHPEILIAGLPRLLSMRERLVGSNMEQLVCDAKVPVLFIRQRVYGPYSSMAVGVDCSEQARHALDRALALFPECAVTAVHAYNVGFNGEAAPGSAIAKFEASRQSAIRAMVERAMHASQNGGDRSQGATIQTYFQHGDPDTVMCTFVHQHQTDLLVVGTHGRTGLWRAMVGSVAARVFDAVPTDILAIHSDA